jgi:hypothetical protein
MPGYLIKVEGLDEVLGSLTAMEKAAARAALAGIKAGAKVTQARAKALAPVGPTGDLAGSITLRSSSRGRMVGVRVGSALDYAAPRMFARHIGGPFARSNVPDPFLNRAIGETAPAVRLAVEATVQALIAEVWA